MKYNFKFGDRVKIKKSQKNLNGRLGTIIKVVIPDFAYEVQIDDTPDMMFATGTFEPEKLTRIKQ
jgi:hypothetical protein